MLRAERRPEGPVCWRQSVRWGLLVAVLLGAGWTGQAAEASSSAAAAPQAAGATAPQYAPERDFSSENRSLKFKPRSENGQAAEAKNPAAGRLTGAGAGAKQTPAPAEQAESLKKKSTGNTVSAVFLAVAILGIFLLFGLWFLKKLLPGGKNLFPTPAMEILGRTHFDQQKYLALVRVGRRVVVVGVAPSGFDAVAEITDAEEITELLAEAKPKTTAGRNLFHRMFQSQLANTERSAALADVACPAGGAGESPAIGALGLAGDAAKDEYAQLQARVRTLRESE